MKSLTPPDIDYRTLYRQAIAQTQRLVDRATLAGLEDQMVEAGENYVGHMTAGAPSAVTSIVLPGPQVDMVRALYDKRIVSKKGACRWVYDQIHSSAAYCPYCGQGEIYEVDHFLHQAGYHDLTMFPGNLVPICHPCNHIKLHQQPQGPTESFIHPYFDTLPQTRWLFAQLDREAGGPILNYWVALDADAHGNLAPRLEYHFRTLELDRRMRTLSAKLLVELQSDVEDLFETLGSEGLQAHFAGEAQRAYSRHGNGLEAAAYLAASQNADFCNGDYRN